MALGPLNTDQYSQAWEKELTNDDEVPFYQKRTDRSWKSSQNTLVQMWSKGKVQMTLEVQMTIKVAIIKNSKHVLSKSKNETAIPLLDTHTEN